MLNKLWLGGFSSLRNRLFLVFLLFILIPYSLLQFYSVSRIQQSFVDQVVHQNTEQLEQLKFIFEDMRSTVFRIAVRLEREPVVLGLLNDPPQDEAGTTRQMEALWTDIKSKALTSPTFTIPC
ncbi:hypothetical protein N6H14_25845 [Paenibacillus sp. CC-CFT747]|nr:hypothetical protein N6H14_25845 [Paenibacillus sp. CC-CFT747]